MNQDYKNKVKKRFDELAPFYSTMTLKFIIKRRIEPIKKYIKNDDRVLEVGCGSGNLLKFIDCNNIYGIDISLIMVSEAKKLCPNGNFLVGDAEKLPFIDETFDKVIMSEVLYYIPELKKAIAEVKRVLKKNGVLLITTVNKKYNFIKFIVNTFRIGLPDNISMPYTSLKELKKDLNKDFKIEKISSIPIKFIPANYSLIFFIAGKKIK